MTGVARGTAALFRFLEKEIFNAQRFFLQQIAEYFEGQEANTQPAMRLLQAAMQVNAGRCCSHCPPRHLTHLSPSASLNTPMPDHVPSG